MMQLNSEHSESEQSTAEWLNEAGPQLKQIHAYWLARCRDGRPSRLTWYDRTVESDQPQYDGRPDVATNGRWMSDETLFLPLSDDGETVNRVPVFAAVSRR